MVTQSDLRSPSSSSGSNDPPKENRKRKAPPTADMSGDVARVKTGASPVSMINGHTTMSIQESLGKAARQKMVDDNKHLLPICINIPFSNEYYSESAEYTEKKKSANPSVVLVGINLQGISDCDNEVYHNGTYLEVKVLEFEAKTVQEIHKDVEGDWIRNRTVYTIVQETTGATDEQGGDAKLPVSLHSIWEDIHKVMDVKLRYVEHKEGCLSLKFPRCGGGPTKVPLMPFVNPNGKGFLCPTCLKIGGALSFTWKESPFQLLTEQVIVLSGEDEGEESAPDVIDVDDVDEDEEEDEIEVYPSEISVNEKGPHIGTKTPESDIESEYEEDLCDGTMAVSIPEAEEDCLRGDVDDEWDVEE
jgi:hypothetical protein